MQETEAKSVLVVGRTVWVTGDMFEGRDRVDQNQAHKPKIIDPKTGLPRKEYGFGLAVPKVDLNDPNKALPLWQAMQQATLQIYPNGVPNTYAWKYVDGDSVDDKGNPYSDREGYKGCIVFAMTTSWKINYFQRDPHTRQFTQITSGIKCGDWLEVQVSVKAHGPDGQKKPGLYLNPLSAQIVGYGKEIVNRPSADQIFGNREVVTPQGASATPIGGGGFPQGGQQQQGQQFAGPGQGQPMGNQFGQQPQGQQGAYQPHNDVLPQHHQQQMQQQGQPFGGPMSGGGQGQPMGNLQFGQQPQGGSFPNGGQQNAGPVEQYPQQQSQMTGPAQGAGQPFPSNAPQGQQGGGFPNPNQHQQMNAQGPQQAFGGQQNGFPQPNGPAQFQGAPQTGGFPNPNGNR